MGLKMQAFLIILTALTLMFFAEFAQGLPDLSWKNQTWTREALDAVAFSDLPDTYPADASDYCKGYSVKPRSQRVEFWAHLISAIAKWESNHKPETILRECQKSRCIYGSCRYHPQYGYCMKGGHEMDGGLVISRGLGQISFQSALGYGCDLKKPADLHDPIKNIKCMVKIAERNVTKDKRIMGSFNGSWRGVSRYWSVTRGVNDYTKRSRDWITKYLRAQAICH